MNANVIWVDNYFRNDVDILLLDLEELRVSNLLDMGSPWENHVLLVDNFIGQDAEVLDGFFDDTANGFTVVLEELVKNNVILYDHLRAKLIVVGEKEDEIKEFEESLF
jgi:hypothetical protein